MQFDGGYIRLLKIKDVHADYVNGPNDPDVNRYLVGVRRTRQTLDGVKSFVDHNLSSNDALLFGIWLDRADKHCGTIRLHGIEHENATAHVGICLFDKSVWGRGIATHAIRAATLWAQQTLKLRWIEAGVYEGNVGSEKAFSSAGYEWVYDIPDKYLYEGKPLRVRVFAARKSVS